MQVKIKRQAPKVCTLELTAREAEVLRRLTGVMFFDHSGDPAFDPIVRALIEGSRSVASVSLQPEQSREERTRIVNEFLAADAADAADAEVATVDVAVGDEILANGQWRRVEAIVNGSAVYAIGAAVGVAVPGDVQDVRKAEPAAGPAAPAMAWPWPAGTKVKFRADDDYGWLVNGKVYTLGALGGRTPQVLDGFVFVCSVEEHDVERVE